MGGVSLPGVRLPFSNCSSMYPLRTGTGEVCGERGGGQGASCREETPRIRLGGICCGGVEE